MDIIKIYIHTYISFFRPKYVLSLTVWTKIGSYDIFYKVIYVTLIYLTKMGMYSSTVIKELSFYLLWVLKSLTLDKSK